MARYRSNNPDILGVDLEDAALEGVIGIGATAVVTDRLVSPIVRGVIPGASGATMLGKLIDAAATVIAGWLEGWVVGMFWNRAVKPIQRGAALLAVGKAVAAILPGYSPLGPLPIPAGLRLNGNGNGQRQLGPGITVGSPNGSQQQVPVTGQTVPLGVGSTGL